MRVNMFGIDWLNRRPGIVDALWLLAVISGGVLIVYTYYTETVAPLRASIECACLSQGDHCREAQQFNYDFWFDYWKVKVPQVFADVQQMKTREFLRTPFLQVLANSSRLAAEASATPQVGAGVAL